jgi:hypothetical protein
MVERTQRDLPVHGSEDAADLREPRRLRNRNLTLAKTNRKIRVDGQLVADRRIDIETIDLWCACGMRGLDAGRATARHDRSGQRRSTRIVRESWTAEPRRPPLITGIPCSDRVRRRGRCRLARCSAAARDDDAHRKKDNDQGEAYTRRHRAQPTLPGSQLAPTHLGAQLPEKNGASRRAGTRASEAAAGPVRGRRRWCTAVPRRGSPSAPPLPRSC